MLDPQGKPTYANRVALDYTGLSLEDIRAALGFAAARERRLANSVA